MARSVAPRPLILIAVTVLFIVNALVFGGRLTAWVTDGSGQLLAPVVRWSAHLRAVTSATIGRGNLASQNIALQDEIVRLKAQMAQQETLQHQMEYYRAASGIRDRTGTQPIAAGIFSYPRPGGVSQAVINRGLSDGVMMDDVVVSPTGALIGEVIRVFERHSVVSTIGDTALDVTVRISGTEVSGLLRTSPDGEILMDLVQKNESVDENSVVVTSGDDRYPAGLVVGTVRNVENDAATLFKTVRITPAIGVGVSGDVIVIRP